MTELERQLTAAFQRLSEQCAQEQQRQSVWPASLARNHAAAGVVELGEVGGQGRVIEPEAVWPGVELAEGAGAAGVCAHRGVDQAACRCAWRADRGFRRGDHGEWILHRTGAGTPS